MPGNRIFAFPLGASANQGSSGQTAQGEVFSSNAMSFVVGNTLGKAVVAVVKKNGVESIVKIVEVVDSTLADEAFGMKGRSPRNISAFSGDGHPSFVPLKASGLVQSLHR